LSSRPKNFFLTIVMYTNNMSSHGVIWLHVSDLLLRGRHVASSQIPTGVKVDVPCHRKYMYMRHLQSGNCTYMLMSEDIVTSSIFQVCAGGVGIRLYMHFGD
jgi:hypothetical protein